VGGGGGGGVFLLCAFCGFFGGGGGGGSPGVAGGDWSGAYSSWLKTGVNLGHAGGLVTSHGIIRAHGGLAPDEIPAILQTGERVLSRGQNASYESGAQKPQVNLTIVNNSSKVDTKQDQSPSGDIIVTIDDLAAQAYSRRGALHKVINAGSGIVRR